MPDDIKLPEPRWYAVMHGAALYGLYDDPQAAVSTAVDLPGNDSVRVERVYTEDQVRAAVLADREGREQCTWTPDDEGVWNTDCGEYFVISDGTPSQNDMRHCCYCGDRLQEADAQRAKEE